MEVEYKIVFRNSQTQQPAISANEIQPQITVDIDEFHKSYEIANPRVGAAKEISDNEDKAILALATALCFAATFEAAFGADVYYRAKNEANWKQRR